MLTLYPEALGGLPDSVLDRLTCPHCTGTGHRLDAEHLPCQRMYASDPRQCLGRGMGCPTCGSAGWSTDRSYPLGDPRRNPPCPGCMSWNAGSQKYEFDEGLCWQTITQFIAAAWAAIEHDALPAAA